MNTRKKCNHFISLGEAKLFFFKENHAKKVQFCLKNSYEKLTRKAILKKRLTFIKVIHGGISSKKSRVLCETYVSSQQLFKVL